MSTVHQPDRITTTQVATEMSLANCNLFLIITNKKSHPGLEFTTTHRKKLHLPIPRVNSNAPWVRKVLSDKRCKMTSIKPAYKDPFR